MARISDKVFQELVSIVYRESGIVLDDKRELMEARMASLARKRGYSGPEEILERIKNDESGGKLIEFLDQVSTNLTYFFREPNHFEFLTRTLLPELAARKKAARSNRIRFWSAACSSGEEPYSLAITAREFFGNDTHWDFKILATDISTRMLRKGMAGAYSRHEVMRAPATLVQQYFHREGDHLNPTFTVREDVRRMVVFRRLNLLQDAYPFKGFFDLIVCRNVMIYFDHPTKQALLTRFHRYMEPGGHLYTGHAESLTSYERLFRRIQVAVYRK